MVSLCVNNPYLPSPHPCLHLCGIPRPPSWCPAAVSVLPSVLSHVGVAVSLMEFHVGEEAFCTSSPWQNWSVKLDILRESLLAPCAALQNSVDGALVKRTKAISYLYSCMSNLHALLEVFISFNFK